MNHYNKPFFSLYENIFLELTERFGQTVSLDIFASLMKKGLGSAYGDDYTKGDPNEFVRLVGERDKLVGLDVRFPLIEKEQFIYQFHTDPFPNLKGKVASEQLDRTYMDFKVKTLLGDNWTYQTTQHLWDGAPYTEHQIIQMSDCSAAA